MDGGAIPISVCTEEPSPLAKVRIFVDWVSELIHRNRSQAR